eukprot:11587339-Alexandrium_andersonii.AAC.1
MPPARSSAALKWAPPRPPTGPRQSSRGPSAAIRAHSTCGAQRSWWRPAGLQARGLLLIM